METVQKFSLIKFIQSNIEWVVFLVGLVLLATMDPYSTKPSLCLLERIGWSGFCPGDGLGHSIAFLFRGEFKSSMEANFMGPIAVVVLVLRIASIWKEKITHKNTI